MLHLSKRIKGKENVELMRHDMIQSSCKLQQMTFHCTAELKNEYAFHLKDLKIFAEF